MRIFQAIATMTLVAAVASLPALAQRSGPLAENAALRYWSAFSEMKDAGISDQQAKELNAILDGSAPYDDARYKDLVDKNTLALKVMARGTSLANCDWGLDYGLGDDVPGEYVRKALVLGRLNVLYAFHLFKTDRREEAVSTLTAGLRYSRDVANGGSLFATLVAKDLLTSHLRAVSDAMHLERLSAGQRAQLKRAAAETGLDWPMAAKRDLEALRTNYAKSPQASEALTRIIQAYFAVLEDEAKLPELDQAVNTAPQELRKLIPNARRVLEQKQELGTALEQTKMLLR